MEPIYETRVSTRLGSFRIRCSARGVREIAFSTPRNGNHTVARAARGGSPHGAKAKQWAQQAARQLREYAAGERRRFTVPLDVGGTEFQKKVWAALRTIPYGQTRSYGQVARQVGNPRAARAVGMANHENPVAVVVPCHRVIASDGSLGGYAGGLRKKSALLMLERKFASRIAAAGDWRAARC